MDNKPLVSIIIPLYNQERYFDKCIRSVCNQTYKNLEIIVVNDGSTDKSPEILSKWASKDLRIKVIEKKNEGPSAARRDGFRHASGEFVTPVDSDDYIPENAIEILAGHMVSKNVDLVQGSMAQIFGFIKRKHCYDGGSFPFHQVVSQPELFNKYYLNFFGKGFFSIMMCGSLYRKSVIDIAMRYTKLCCKEIPFVGEDHYCHMKLFPFLNSMYRTNETVYYYRYGGASTDRFSPSFPALFFLSDERLKLLDHFGLEDGYNPLFEEYANCVYYHAQQLLEFKRTDKNGVISFFKQELSARQLYPRMLDFYQNNETENIKIQLMLRKNYEGMYNLANSLMRERCYSLKHICKVLFLRISYLIGF